MTNDGEKTKRGWLEPVGSGFTGWTNHVLVYALALLIVHPFIVPAAGARQPRNAAPEANISYQDVPSQWETVALKGVSDSHLGAPMVARALAIINTCMYDAWAAYDDRAAGTQLGTALRRPLEERTLGNKMKTISYAAYKALTDVLPANADSDYSPLMRKLGYDPHYRSVDIETPEGIGNVACDAVLEFRHHDRANQLGDLAPGAYSDWSGYTAANKPTPLLPRIPASDPDRWQPLRFVNSTGDVMTQRFSGAQWCYVAPFALHGGDQYRWLMKLLAPAKFGSQEYRDQAQELIELSAHLTDREKMIAEYWSDGPHTEQPPGHWMRFAEWLSARDQHTLDDDVKMFFVLSNSMFDAGIAAWDAKREFDSVRPVTAISLVFKGQRVRAWGGPGKGTIEMDASQWMPYQQATFPTPPFPDFVSGHSTYSAAAARVLSLWTGSDHFGYSTTLPARSSKIEPRTTPASPLTLKWETFTDAANEAGMSRRYGGIHFARADLGGRLLGKLVAADVWSKSERYFEGTANPNWLDENQGVQESASSATDGTPVQ